MAKRPEETRFRLEVRTVLPDSIPCHAVDGATVEVFRDTFCGIDWAEEWATAWWAKALAPGLAVTDQVSDSTLWVCVYNWMAELVRGGGSTYRETCEFVIGHAGLNAACDAANLRVQSSDDVVYLFRLFFAGDHDGLKKAMGAFPTTDIYDVPW